MIADNKIQLKTESPVLFFSEAVAIKKSWLKNSFLLFNHSNVIIMKKVIKRMKKQTPRFFKRVRNTGLVLAGISAAIFASPVALPVFVTQIAGYMAVAATVASTVSQAAVKNERQ